MNLDPRFELTDEILKALHSMREKGSPHDEIIWYLFHAGVPKPGVILGLRVANIMGLGQAKEITHNHPAFEFRRTNDEAFRDSLFAELEASGEIEYLEQSHIAA